MQWGVREDGAATAEEEEKSALRRMGGFLNTTQCFGTSCPCGLKLYHAFINTGLELINLVAYLIQI